MGGRVMGTFVVAAALLLGAGCGGDDGGDEGAADETTTTDEASTTTAGETSTTAAAAPSKPWYNLLEGDCIEPMPADAGFTDVATIDCAEPHEGEVVFTGQPGNAGAEGRCAEAAEAYAGQAVEDSTLTWFSASEEPPGDAGGVPALPPSGAAGADLMVVCVVTSASGTTTGSIAG